MRILIAHNHYQQPGGEDVVAAFEHGLLVKAGHEVHLHTVHNDQIQGFGQKLSAFAHTPYSSRSAEQFGILLGRVKPDIVHIHNYFPLLTPAIFFACHARGIPVVHTLHNFRTMCLNGFLLRDGKVCEKCVGKTPYWGVVHRCYRGSLPGSVGVARMIRAQRDGNWADTVRCFIALTDFERRKFIQAGFPADRVVVKPNSVVDPQVHDRHPAAKRRGGLFVGRLSPEKGLRTLIEAWRGLDYPLRIAGDGPISAELRSGAPENVTFLGRIDHKTIYAEMADAAFLVMPSTWYEGFPVTVAEAYACGLPIIASRIGSLAELVEHGTTGLLFQPGDVDDLRKAIQSAVADPQTLAAMSAAARGRYEARYTAEPNLGRLLEVYEMALAPTSRGLQATRQFSHREALQT